MKESMGKKGYNQGDMSPKVDDYQLPSGDFSQAGFSKTTQYIERQDKIQAKNTKTVKNQAYQGRYS